MISNVHGHRFGLVCGEIAGVECLEQPSGGRDYARGRGHEPSTI